MFPEEYVAIVQVAETSGTVPEALHRMSPEFEAEARRSLKALTMATGWLISGLVAAFIVLIIFKIAMWYVNLINTAVGEAMK